MRERILATLLAIAALLIVAGVAQWDTAAAFITAGVLTAGWAWLTFGELAE